MYIALHSTQSQQQHIWRQWQHSWQALPQLAPQPLQQLQLVQSALHVQPLQWQLWQLWQLQFSPPQQFWQQVPSLRLQQQRMPSSSPQQVAAPAAAWSPEQGRHQRQVSQQ